MRISWSIRAKSMMTISPVFLILNDTLIDPALDALHGLQPDRLNAFPAGRQSHALHNPEPQCAGVRTDCDDYSSGAGAAGARDADAVGEWVLNASVVKQFQCNSFDFLYECDLQAMS
jgi:hypothetical protein